MIEREFVSLSDLINFGRAHASHREDAEWAGVRTFDEAETLARNGWHDIRDDIDRIVDSIRNDLRETTADVWTARHDVTGAAVDVGAFLQGVPECMVEHNLTREASFGRVVVVNVNVGALADVSPDHIMKRGAAIVALIETLAILNHTVELWAESTVTQAGNTVTIHTRIKAEAEPLDVDAIMYCFAHPSMLRHLVFAARKRMTGSSNGMTQRSRKGETIGAHVEIDTPSHYEQAVTDAAEWIRDRLRGLDLIE